MRLSDLLPPIQRIEGNTEVAAVASMEMQELLQKIATSIGQAVAGAMPAPQQAPKNDPVNDDQKQHDDLEEEERKKEQHHEEMGRFKKLQAAFDKLGDKLKGLGGGLDFLGTVGKVFAALMSQYLLPHLINIGMAILPKLGEGLAWLFGKLMAAGSFIGSFIDAIFGIESGMGSAIGALAGLAAALWLVMNPLKALKTAFNLLVGAFQFFARKLSAQSVGGTSVGGASDGMIPEGNDQRRSPGRRGRRGGRVPTGPNRAPAPQQTTTPRPSVRPQPTRVSTPAPRPAAGAPRAATPVARTAATGVAGRVVQGGASAATGTAARTAASAIPVVGTAAAVGLGAYGAYTSIQEIDAAVAAGEMTKAEASEAKGEAVGGAAGGAAGALGGAAAGAAIGSVVPVVGTAIGGIVGGIAGYYGGDWLGSKAGGAIGSSMADETPAATPVPAPVPTPVPAPPVVRATPAVVPSATSFWSGQSKTEEGSEEESSFLERMFRDQVDYLLMQSKLTPLVIQHIDDFKPDPLAMTAFGQPSGGSSNFGGGRSISNVGDTFSAPPPPAPSRAPAASGTTSVPTTRVSPPAAGSPLGSVSKKYETGGAGPGTVSTGRGDAGGVSYGSFQMASTRGTVQQYLAQSKYGPEFAGMQVNSEEFKNKWKEIAERDPDGFQADQFTFIKAGHYDPAVRAIAQRVGIDVNKRGRALQEAVFSTAVQFGPGATAGLMQGAGVTADMSDVDIIKALQQRKRDRNDALFKSSSANVRAGTLGRASREEADLLALAATEQGGGGAVAGAPAASGGAAPAVASTSAAPPAVSPATRPTGTALASTSSQTAIAATSPPPNNVVVSSPVSAPTNIMGGRGGGGGSTVRTAAPPPAVTYDVGAIA